VNDGSYVTANNFNLFGHDRNVGVVGFIPGTTDIVPFQPLGAILNTRPANNGGPTQTHALVEDSPATDAINNGTCPLPATGQRGITRPRDGNGDGGPACDIGSYEFVFTGAAPIQTPPQSVAPTPPQPVAPTPTQPGGPAPAQPQEPGMQQPPPQPTQPPVTTLPDQAITEPAPPAPASPDEHQTGDTGQTDTLPPDDNTQLEEPEPVSSKSDPSAQPAQSTAWGI
jgi:hypothetical protein